MKPLVKEMVQDDPSQRPTIHQVVERFSRLRKSLPWWTLRSRVADVEDDADDGRLAVCWRIARHAGRQAFHILTCRKAIPSPPRRPLHTFRF